MTILFWYLPVYGGRCSRTRLENKKEAILGLLADVVRVDPLHVKVDEKREDVGAKRVQLVDFG